jgi:hypothetical protein
MIDESRAVVPIHDGCHLPLERFTLVRHQQQAAQEALHRQGGRKKGTQLFFRRRKKERQKGTQLFSEVRIEETKGDAALFGGSYWTGRQDRLAYWHGRTEATANYAREDVGSALTHYSSSPTARPTRTHALTTRHSPLAPLAQFSLLTQPTTLLN